MSKRVDQIVAYFKDGWSLHGKKTKSGGHRYWVGKEDPDFGGIDADSIVRFGELSQRQDDELLAKLRALPRRKADDAA